MSNIEHIYDHQGYACGDCGSVKFVLLRSGKIECYKCGVLINREHYEIKKDNSPPEGEESSET